MRSLWNIDIKLIILSVFFFSAVNVHVLKITIYMDFNIKNEATKLMHKRHNLFVNYSLNCTGLGVDRLPYRFTRLNFSAKSGAHTVSNV